MPRNKKPRKAFRPDRRPAIDRLPSLLEMHALFTPIFNTLDELASGEVMHEKGIPVMLFEGELAEIHAALIGWACCWDRICKDRGVAYDSSPLRKLAKKLENGVMLEETDINQARASVELTRQVFMRTPASVLKQHSITEQIAIEFERRDLIKEAA